MSEDIIAVLNALTRLLEEESMALAGPHDPDDLSRMAAAKARLAADLARFDTALASGEAAAAGDPALRAAVAALRDAALVNAEVVRRRLHASSELLGALRAELAQAAGAGTSYGAAGQAMPSGPLRAMRHDRES